ncbi:hypothetical protein EF405_04040 [Cyclobacteriaceae bacterium YHN15]|nr:hypothetical protein EF405_04040 [Cyclobacteriaceae bacterium YHN15]
MPKFGYLLQAPEFYFSLNDIYNITSRYSSPKLIDFLIDQKSNQAEFDLKIVNTKKLFKHWGNHKDYPKFVEL